ncbi:unnamed protein product, partial [Tuber aestivum]
TRTNLIPYRQLLPEPVQKPPHPPRDQKGELIYRIFTFLLSQCGNGARGCFYLKAEPSGNISWLTWPFFFHLRGGAEGRHAVMPSTCHHGFCASGFWGFWWNGNVWWDSGRWISLCTSRAR